MSTPGATTSCQGRTLYETQREHTLSVPGTDAGVLTGSVFALTASSPCQVSLLLLLGDLSKLAIPETCVMSGVMQCRARTRSVSYTAQRMATVAG